MGNAAAAGFERDMCADKETEITQGVGILRWEDKQPSHTHTHAHTSCDLTR